MLVSYNFVVQTKRERAPVRSSLEIMKAYLNNYRMSPRKVRLVGDAVKGKNVAQADVVLSFMPKKAARIIRTLIRSAVSNAINNEGKQAEMLFVKTVEVNQGVTLKRFRPRARGSASPINKRTSNISVFLTEDAGKSKKIKAAPKQEVVAETEKKVATKKVAKKTATKKTTKKVESKEKTSKKK